MHRIDIRYVAFVLVIYLFFTLSLTYPQWLYLETGVNDDGDPLLNTWILAWHVKHLFTFNQVRFHANIFYPYQYTLAYSELMLSNAILAAPVIWITGKPLLAYNLLSISSFFLSALSMLCLAYYLTKSKEGALISGIVFGFCLFRFDHLSHLQILTSWWVPLIFIFFHKYLFSPTWRNALTFSILWLLQVLTCYYYGLFISVILAFLLVYSLLFSTTLRSFSNLLKLFLPLLGAIFIVVLVSWPYFLISSELGFFRNPPHGADILSYFATPYSSVIYGKMTSIFSKPECNLFPGFVSLMLGMMGVIFWLKRYYSKKLNIINFRRSLNTINFIIFVQILIISIIVLSGGVEFEIFNQIVSIHRLTNPILVLIFTLIIKYIYFKNSKYRLLNFLYCTTNNQVHYMNIYVLIFILSFFFSLGIDIKLDNQKLLPGPYTLLYYFIPGFKALRVPSRFALFIYISIAVFSAYTIKSIINKSLNFNRLKKNIFIAFVLIFLWFDTNCLPLKVFVLPSEIPSVYMWLAKKQDISEKVILELPFHYKDYQCHLNSIRMYYSTMHWGRLINGYSGFVPPLYYVINEYFYHFPNRMAIKLCKILEVDYIIAHLDEFKNRDRAWFLKTIAGWSDDLTLVYNFGNMSVYEFKKSNNSILTKPLLRNQLPYNKSSWSASASNININPNNAIDDNLHTFWQSNGTRSPKQFIIIDFNVPIVVKNVRFSCTIPVQVNTSRIKIMGSYDGQEWIYIRSTLNLPLLIRSVLDHPKNYIHFEEFLVRQKLRFIKFLPENKHNHYLWRINEIDIFK